MKVEKNKKRRIPFRSHEQTLKDKLFFRLFFKKTKDLITPEELEYFKHHKDEIEEFSRPLNIHKYFLFIGVFSGIIIIGVSKFIDYTGMINFFGAGLKEFFIHIIYELGVALLGASATAYLLGVLLNRQRKNAIRWKIELTKMIEESENAARVKDTLDE